eukprot:8216317-Pyramimonas_sp.AAC.1
MREFYRLPLADAAKLEPAAVAQKQSSLDAFIQESETKRLHALQLDLPHGENLPFRLADKPLFRRCAEALAKSSASAGPAPLTAKHVGSKANIEDAYGESQPPPALLDAHMWPTAGRELGQAIGPIVPRV